MKKKLLITLLITVATATYSLAFIACNPGNSDNTPAHTHKWSKTYIEDGDSHYQTCSDCGEKQYSNHTYTDGVCICGKYMPVNGTVGMTYGLNENGKSYSLTGIGITKETEIIIPTEYDGLPVTKISKSAFQGCTSLTSVTIPYSTTEIGKNAFYYCTSLTHITIPDSVTEIGNWAFYECKLLKNVNIPNGITTIGESTFNGCRSFTSIVIPNGVTTIGEKAFLACTSLTDITIPNSVTSIGISAFSSCYSLSNITFKGTVKQWNEIIKSRHWNYSIDNYIVHCTDGEVAKDGTVTMY